MLAESLVLVGGEQAEQRTGFVEAEHPPPPDVEPFDREQASVGAEFMRRHEQPAGSGGSERKVLDERSPGIVAMVALEDVRIDACADEFEIADRRQRLRLHAADAGDECKRRQDLQQIFVAIVDGRQRAGREPDAAALGRLATGLCIAQSPQAAIAGDEQQAHLVGLDVFPQRRRENAEIHLRHLLVEGRQDRRRCVGAVRTRHRQRYVALGLGAVGEVPARVRLAAEQARRPVEHPGFELFDADRHGSARLPFRRAAGALLFALPQYLVQRGPAFRLQRQGCAKRANQAQQGLDFEVGGRSGFDLADARPRHACGGGQLRLRQAALAPKGPERGSEAVKA